MACWQNEHLFLSTKLEYIMNTKCFYDVIFIVGQPPNQKQFHSHKFLLSIYSDVLQVMLYDTSIRKNNSNHQIIYVEDVEEHIFEKMLKFIYTERIDADYLPDVTKLFYLAEKYNIYPLMFQCKTIMEAELATDNVCITYHVALLSRDQDLIEKCEKVIKHETMDVLKSKSFTKLPISVIEKIASFNFLKIPDELVLFEAILNWAKEQACKKGKKPTPDILRKIMDPILPHIRFLSMTHNQLFSSPIASEIFKKDEIADIAMHISQPQQFSALPNWCNSKRIQRIVDVETIPQLLRFCFSNKNLQTGKKLILKCFIKPLWSNILINGFSLCFIKSSTAPILYIAEHTKTIRLLEFMEDEEEQEERFVYRIKFLEPVFMKKNCNYYIKALTNDPVIMCEQSVKCDVEMYSSSFLGITYVLDNNCHLRDITCSIAGEKISEDINIKNALQIDKEV